MGCYSRLPAGGENLFQQIKRKRREAEEAGRTIYNLAIGQPQGPALLSAREAAARAIMSSEESMHEYQDNGSPGVPDFARKFVEWHTGPLPTGEVEFLPIPGIKPMLGLIPLACGCSFNARRIGGTRLTVASTTKPGYPTPAVWCGYLGDIRHYPLPLNVNNRFLFAAGDIEAGTDLVMMNYPHNPSGQVSPREWLGEICSYCEKYGIRLFNDAPYIALSHSQDSCSLTQVAMGFRNLSWAEAFSASKVIRNGTGWRIGAVAGSPDFVADIATIKGNTDSGFVAPMAAGVLAALESSATELMFHKWRYDSRICSLIEILSRHGLRLAVKPGAGFFTLWETPSMAFGQRIWSAEQFNFLMIERTGVLGVHFHPYIRYAVCGPVEDMAQGISQAFFEAAVSYDE